LSTGGHSPKWRTLREEEEFAHCIERLGDAERMDDALANLKWKLSRDAEGNSFPIPRRKLRITFTEELCDSPVYRVFFWIESE
jgi:hypothetical protein